MSYITGTRPSLLLSLVIMRNYLHVYCFLLCAFITFINFNCFRVFVIDTKTATTIFVRPIKRTRHSAYKKKLKLRTLSPPESFLYIYISRRATMRAVFNFSFSMRVKSQRQESTSHSFWTEIKTVSPLYPEDLPRSVVLRTQKLRSSPFCADYSGLSKVLFFRFWASRKVTLHARSLVRSCTVF